jgi:hypothetical protein
MNEEKQNTHVIRTSGPVRWMIIFTMTAGLVIVSLGLYEELFVEKQQFLIITVLIGVWFFGGYALLALIFTKTVFTENTIEYTNSLGVITRRSYEDIIRVDKALDQTHFKMTFNDGFSLKITKLVDPGGNIEALLKSKNMFP